MTILIMCQGQQTRFHGTIDYPKHFIQVNGERIIDRTLRLLSEHDRHSREPFQISVIAPREFDLADRDAVDLTDHGGPGICILDGIWHTRRLWSATGRTTILLGDVVFSREALYEIIHTGDPIQFWGTPKLTGSEGEVFAMTFNRTHQADVAHALGRVKCRQVQESYNVYQGSHLRNLLWNLPEGVRSYGAIDDFTTDIDTPTDLGKIPALEVAIRAEPS